MYKKTFKFFVGDIYK